MLYITLPLPAGSHLLLRCDALQHGENFFDLPVHDAPLVARYCSRVSHGVCDMA